MVAYNYPGLQGLLSFMFANFVFEPLMSLKNSGCHVVHAFIVHSEGWREEKSRTQKMVRRRENLQICFLMLVILEGEKV